MKYLVVLGLLALSIRNLGAADPTPVNKGLTVHEWGVFRVNDDAEFANAEMRAAWDELPEFAYGYIKGRSVPQHWGGTEFRRQPLIFFHATQPTLVRVKVDFPRGMAGVWFPATEKPSVIGNMVQPKVGESLEWNLGIKTCPNGWRPKRPAPPELPAAHYISRLRQVKSDEVFSRFSPNNPLDVEREKFVYYDGIFPHGKWLKIAVDKERVALTSQVKHAVFDVTVVDRRGDKPRVGRIAKLEAGTTIANVPFVDIEAARLPLDGSATLVKQLIDAGLYADEAQSLADLWQKDMFETPGLCLFYRLPQEEYDVRLPLTLTPKAEEVVRVGLVYHGHLEPDFAGQILELVRQLDAQKFPVRDAAMKKLLAIGPVALVQIRRLREKRDLSVEVRERLDGLVKKWDAKEAFDK